MGKFSDALSQQQSTTGKFGAAILQQQPINSGFNATYQDTDETLYDNDLVNDVNFQKASEVIYNMNNSVDAPRLTPEDYAKYGIETMGWFNWNLPKMSMDANRISGASEEQKKAFLYMMESYDDLGVSWNGAKRFFKGVALDPTTYVGLTTFGIGLAGKEGAKQVGKQGIKELLKSSTRGGIIAGVESGVYTAVDDINRQVVETAVSGEDIDVGRVVKSGAIGTVAGFGLGTAITAGVKKYAGKSTKEIAETVDEAKLADELPDNFDEATELYHGSDRDFDTFDTTADRVNNTMNVRGVYLYGEARKESAKNFGSNTYTVVAKKDLKTFNRQGDNELSPEMIEQHKIELDNAGYGRGGQEELDEYATSFEKWSNIDGDAKARVLKAGGYEKYVDGDEIVILDASNTKIVRKNGDDLLAPIDPQSTAARIRKDLDGVIQAIKRTVPSGKAASLREDGTQDLTELVESVAPFKQMLEEASAKNPQELAEYLKKIRLTDGEAEYLEVATTQTVSALKVKVYNLRLKQQQLDGEEALAISKQIDEIEEVIAPLDELDAAMSTITGQRLRARQESLNTGDARGVTIKSLEEQGLSRTEAERQFDAIFAEKMIKHEQTEVVKKFDAQIETARKNGDTSEYLRLKHEKKVKLDEFKEDVLKEEGSALYRAINKPIKVMNEVMISFVFSPATLIVNTVPSLAKSLYKPFLNNLMQDGLSATSRKKMVAEYSAMASMIPSAAKMARAAWRYEKSILTGDSARFLEEYNTIPKKYGGGILRHFPRALLATDAFFENIHYRGYAVGNATGNAMEAGVAKGLKGKELDDFVKKEVDKALQTAYAPEENAIDILMQDGVSRGLKGKKLENFINKELEANPEVFTKATDQNGRDYVQDVLFKRDFSGNGAASQLARGYEGFVNKHPVMRLAGQLFFRTPVRVFEEGIRMTPGLNLISPNFMKDLKGVNGPMRQARAQGEALMSYAIAGSVFAMYAKGDVTGAMGQDYKQTRQGENAGGQEPYTIKFSDGSTFNYRNFDPFSTPVKIIVNALERAETLAYRTEQGEKVDKTELDRLQAIVAVGVGSIAQSLRDANLASGVDAVADFWEDLQNEDSSDQLIKFVGRKVQTFLPNTYYKAQMLDNPVLGDPVTMEQFIRQRVNPADPLVPKQYTALGRARTASNPAASLYYFDTATVEERKRGVPQKELEVEEFLYKLAQVGDTHFTAPYKYPKYMGKVDLRKQLTKDGKETYYDRWMRYTHESNLVDVLHRFRDLPMGTASNPGAAETAAKKYINKYREIAFVKLLKEEGNLVQQRRSVLEKEAKAKSGQRSIDNIPFNITGTR